jgi:hypothetical protein
LMCRPVPRGNGNNKPQNQAILCYGCKILLKVTTPNRK